MTNEKIICIATGTRADYGLLKPLIVRISEIEGFTLKLVVTGMHLCAEFGNTWKEIENDGVSIDEKLEVLMASDTNAAMTKSTAIAIHSFTEYFERKRPDLLIILGDRFEMLACSIAAAFTNIPIAHIYGGDTTEGAIDEFIRHSITKMSYLHFTSNAQSRNRVIQLGEAPERVYNVGALSVENALSTQLLDKKTLEERIGFSLGSQYGLVTYHPSTLDTENRAEQETKILLSSLDRFPDMQFIITKANADANGKKINSILSEYTASKKNCILVDSMGLLLYLSAMKTAAVVIGNSSSGIYEAPGFHIPTVNIGNRQRGRLHAGSIINCNPTVEEISSSIEKALSPEWKAITNAVVNPFGDGTTSEKIVDIIKEYLQEDKIMIMKCFHDLSHNEDD
jgi:GDP/UDP-N,N'-diacetylbacillosamine 2-epimerase (hydrolysing)